MSITIIGQEQKILQMFPAETGALGKITTGIFKAVAGSFEQQSMKNPTRAEIQNRFEICMKWAKTFRGDLKWGLDRIVGEIPNALRAELLHVDYTPPSRQSWIPEDGAL